MGGKQRIMALYQTQPDRSLRAKALAKEYGIGGHSHDYLDGSRGFVNHDGRGMEFDHYPEHKKFTLSWTQVEKYIDLMIQSDRYLTDKEKEHHTPPVSAEPNATLTHAKNLIREFCQEEYDSEPDFSDLSKIGVAYTNATDEDIPIQVNVDLVGYRVERYLGEVLIDERQYESLEDLTETELEALDFSELVSVTDEELEHYHSKAEERPALLPLDAAAEYNALKEQYPDALVGFEQNGYYEFYGEDARKVCELLGGKLLEKETALGTVPVTGFPSNQWVYRAKQLWQRGENVYLAGLNEDATFVVCLNDRDADGTDISWIWDADFERLAAMGEHLRQVFVSGPRADELRLRLKYAGVDEANIQVFYDYDPLIDAMCASEYPVFIMPTYTSMLDLRGRLQKQLGGKEFWE